MLLCDNLPNGEVVPFVRIYSDDCTTDLTVNGAPYAVMGMVAPCTEDQQDGCDTTTPVSVVGLCLVDGTPIAVVMQRDCEGIVSAPGWVNLATGVFTAGVVPVGAAPCDSTVAAMATGLTLSDGTPITVVSQRDSDGVVTQTGWINTTTGVFTAGSPPATVRAPGDAEPDLAVLCDTAPDGAVTSFVRQYRRDRAGDVIGITNYTLTGAPYVPTGAVGACDAVPPCASPTTPLATTGLCLADGTPIATVSTRDCAGAVSTTGWVNLLTGTFTPGAPPFNAQACGTSMDIETSSVLCDTDPATGEVFALVVVEYHYDADGAVESVRLVRADDATTYTLQGELTTCASSCVQCSTVALCDQPSTASEPTIDQYAASTGTLPNGVTFLASDAAAAVAGQDQWLWQDSGYLSFDRPVTVTFDVRVFTDPDARVILPPGAELVTLSPDHTWNPATRQLGPVSAATPQTAVSTFRMVATSGFDIGRLGDAAAAQVGNLQVLALDPTPFLRTICRACDGIPAAVVDTAMDGVTPYVVTGTAGACLPDADGDAPCCPEPVCYAGSTAGDVCAAGVLQELPTIDPTITSATVEANPNALTVTALGSSHNGTTTGDWTTVGVDGTGAATGLVLRYNFGSPGDIAQIVLWNNFGSILDDFDGIGTATLTVYDAADTVLFTGPLNAGNGAAPFSTPFGGGLLEGAAYFTLSDIVRIAGSGVTTIGWREIRGVGSYRALITWECPDETISALVEGPLAGITYDGVNITQTNGPHTFTFSSSRGAFDATLETDNPAAWSTTEVSAANPVTVLSGNASLSVQVEPVSSLNISAGLLHPDGTVTDANTGQVVTDPELVPCVAPPAPDHIITGHILEMCEAGHSFLRHVRVTRDATVLVTDTEIDGRSPYVVVSEDAVTAGPCTRDRLGDVCAELGPLLTPSEAVGFSQAGDCWVTSGDSPDLTYTGDIDSIEFSVVGGLAGGPSFRLVLNGSIDVFGSAFTPPIPMFPTAIDTYTGTATVGGITVTAEIVDGALALANDFSGQFGLAGRMRFTFSPQVSSVQINTTWGNDPNLQLCDIIVLPSTMPDPQQLSAFRSGDGTVTYYAADGTEIDNPVLLDCGACCNGEAGGSGGTDVETDVLCFLDPGGTPLGAYIAEYGYDTAGTRVFTRITDPVTGAEVAVPPGSQAVDCDALTTANVLTANTEVLCVLDVDGTLIQEVVAEYRYNTGAVRVSFGLADPTTGDPYFLPPGATLGTCGGRDTPVLTGIRRLTGDTAVQDLKAEFVGLQSVTLTVFAGSVDVTMSNGAAVSVPVGATLSWTVVDQDDSTLDAASFDGPAGADYLLTWTWKATAAG